MKVELLNKTEVTNLFKRFGRTSAICYNSNADKSEKIAKRCIEEGHFSGSRSRYFEFLITDCPRFTIDQAVRHEQGVCKNVQSFRYVDKHNFTYEVPIEIVDNKELLEEYKNHMNQTIEVYTDIQKYVVSKTRSRERANEQARYVLPMATNSSFVFCLDLEALIHLMHKRLCVRTEDKFRLLAENIRIEVLKVLPELSPYLVPQCQYLLWCPEGKSSCGAYPTKEETEEKLTKFKNIKVIK